MPAFGRLIGIALVVAILISGAAAVLVGALSRQGGQKLPAFDPHADTPTRHVDMTKKTENLALTALTEAELGQRGVTRHKLGELDVPTGSIVATDPAVQPERPAFARTVRPGSYPVTIYIAQSRVAMTELRFAPGTPTRWQIAVIPGQDAGTLKDDEIFGYPVDAGLGCFMDAKGRDAFLRRDAQERTRLGSKYVSSYDDVMAGPLDANGSNEVMLQPLPDESANMAIFQSGWGDGYYASYWGLDDAGAPLLLVTDLGVIENGDGRDRITVANIAAIAAMTPEQRRDGDEGYAALKAGDLPRLDTLLATRRITPETLVEEVGGTLTFEAIRLDRPAALEMLIRHGAVKEIPEYVGLDTKTYPDLAHSYSKLLPADAPPGLKQQPRSPALLDVVRRWEAGEIPASRPAP